MSVSFQPGSVGSTRNVRQESIPEQQQSTMVKTRNIHTTSSSDVVLPAGSTDGEVEGEKGKGKKTAKIRGGGGKKGGGKAAKGKKKTDGEETDAGGDDEDRRTGCSSDGTRSSSSGLDSEEEKGFPFLRYLRTKHLNFSSSQSQGEKSQKGNPKEEKQ